MSLNHFGILFIYNIVLINIVYFTNCLEIVPTCERPNVTYVNPKFFSFFNLTSQRYSRKDPRHYMGVHFNLLTGAGNNVTLFFVYKELLTNRYKPTFVEINIKLCELEKDDFVIGAAMKNALVKMLEQMPEEERFVTSISCPYPAGIYHLVNMTTPASRWYKSFPFQKGRVYLNATIAKELAVSLHIDIEMKNLY